MASLSQIVSSKPKTGEKRSVCKEKDKVALEIDLYVVRWKVKRIEGIAPVVVGHIPRQILRAICFFPEKGGAVTGKLFEERCRSFFIHFERWFRDFFTDQYFNRSRKQEVSQQVKMYHLWKLWPFFRDEFLFFCKEGKELEEGQRRHEKMTDLEQVIIFEDDDDELKA